MHTVPFLADCPGNESTQPAPAPRYPVFDNKPIYPTDDQIPGRPASDGKDAGKRSIAAVGESPSDRKHKVRRRSTIEPAAIESDLREL